MKETTYPIKVTTKSGCRAIIFQDIREICSAGTILDYPYYGVVEVPTGDGSFIAEPTCWDTDGRAHTYSKRGNKHDLQEIGDLRA